MYVQTAEKANESSRRHQLQFFWRSSKFGQISQSATTTALVYGKFMLSGSQNSNNKPMTGSSTALDFPAYVAPMSLYFFFPLFPCFKNKNKRKRENNIRPSLREDIGLYSSRRGDHIRNSNYKNKLVVYLYSCVCVCLCVVDPFSDGYAHI